MLSTMFQFQGEILKEDIALFQKSYNAIVKVKEY